MKDRATDSPKEAVKKTTDELDLFDFFHYLFRKKKVLALVMAAALLLSYAYVTFVATPIYEGTSQIYVVSSSSSVVNLSDLQVGSYLASDYQWVLKTWEVNQTVIDNLRLPYDVGYMRQHLTVTNPSNTRLLFITFSSPKPKEAADVANEYAEVARQYIYDKMYADKPSIVSAAKTPLKPAQPRKLLIIFAATAGAGFLAVWCLFIVYMRDNKVKNPSDLRKITGCVPLAVIPVTSSGHTRKKGKGK